MADVDDMLARVPLFSMLGRRDLAALARSVHERTFPAGHTLTDERDIGTAFTVIAEGTAEVVVQGQPVATLGPGDWFGEMALIDGQLRSATVTATTDLRCLLLTHWVFKPFAMDHPEVAWALLEVMVQRVRDAEARTPATD